MLSISTSPCYECDEVISPRAIAKGRGDGYLIRLNQFLVEWKRPTYIRLLPEMNGYWNPYAAFNSDGSPRDAAHTGPSGFGGPGEGRADHRSRRQARPAQPQAAPAGPAEAEARQRQGAEAPRAAQAAFIWVPQTHGSPRDPAEPARRLLAGAPLRRLGRRRHLRQVPELRRACSASTGSARDFPFMIGEWSPWDYDNPGFVDALHEWAESHRRAKMLVYFQGFGDNNPFMIQRYPASAAALRGQLDNRRYQRFAPHSSGPGGKGGEGRRRRRPEGLTSDRRPEARKRATQPSDQSFWSSSTCGRPRRRARGGRGRRARAAAPSRRSRGCRSRRAGRRRSRRPAWPVPGPSAASPGRGRAARSSSARLASILAGTLRNGRPWPARQRSVGQRRDAIERGRGTRRPGRGYGRGRRRARPGRAGGRRRSSAAARAGAGRRVRARARASRGPARCRCRSRPRPRAAARGRARRCGRSPAAPRAARS